MRKVYVGVAAEFRPDGLVLPRQIFWEDGTRYPVDRVLDIRKAASLKVGGVGLRYRVRVLGRESYIWLEDGKRWFVEAKR